jgi:hypothetical protein
MLNENGISTTRGRGQFRAEKFFSATIRRWYWQWDYRDSKGRLFTGIAPTEEEAQQRAARQTGEVISYDVR